jgi:hypothetical protein
LHPLCYLPIPRLSLWGKFSKFHLTEKLLSKQPEAEKQEVYNLVSKTQNLIFTDGFEPNGKPGYQAAANKKKNNNKPDDIASNAAITNDDAVKETKG